MIIKITKELNDSNVKALKELYESSKLREEDIVCGSGKIEKFSLYNTKKSEDVLKNSI